MKLIIDVCEVIIVMLTANPTESMIFWWFRHIDLFLFLLHFVNFIEVEIVVRIQILLHLLKVTFQHKARSKVKSVLIEHRSAFQQGSGWTNTTALVFTDAGKHGEVYCDLGYTFRGSESFDLESGIISGVGMFSGLVLLLRWLHNLLLISAFLTYLYK